MISRHTGVSRFFPCPIKHRVQISFKICLVLLRISTQIVKEQSAHHCGLPIDTSEDREIVYKIPMSMGGRDETANMAYVHKHCQTIFLERRAKA